MSDRRYADEAATQDQLLDAKLREIRNQADTGQISMREAADARVVALEHHLAAVRALNAEFFGAEPEPGDFRPHPSGPVAPGDTFDSSSL